MPDGINISSGFQVDTSENIDIDYIQATLITAAAIPPERLYDGKPIFVTDGGDRGRWNLDADLVNWSRDADSPGTWWALASVSTLNYPASGAASFTAIDGITNQLDLSGQDVAETYDFITQDILTTGRTSIGDANFLRFQNNGSDVFRLTDAGIIFANTGSSTNPVYSFSTAATTGLYNSTLGLGIATDAVAVADFGANIELHGAGGSFGATVEGVKVLRLNEATTTPTGLVAGGGLIYVLGNALHYLDAAGADTDLTAAAAGGGAFTADADTQITPTVALLLDHAANNEVAFDLSGTINKAAGTSDWIFANVTTTTNLDNFLRFQDDGTDVFRVDNTGAIHIPDLIDIKFGTNEAFLRGNGAANQLKIGVANIERYEIDSTHFGSISGTGAFRISRNQTPTSTDAIFQPTNSDLTTGYGGTSGELHLITGGVEAINIDASQVVDLVNGLQVNGDTTQRIRTVHLQLTQAQIQSLNTTRILMIVAPGAGKYIQLVGVGGSAYYNHNGTNYVGGDVLTIENASGTNLVAVTNIIASTVDVVKTFTGLNDDSPAFDTAVYLIADADSTGAGGTIDVYVQYVIIDTN